MHMEKAPGIFCMLLPHFKLGNSDGVFYISKNGVGNGQLGSGKSFQGQVQKTSVGKAKTPGAGDMVSSRAKLGMAESTWNRPRYLAVFIEMLNFVFDEAADWDRRLPHAADMQAEAIPRVWCHSMRDEKQLLEGCRWCTWTLIRRCCR